MVTYQFDVEGDIWDRWKDTVPRSKNLDDRLRELVVADTEGRVEEADTDDTDDTGSERGAETYIETSTPTPDVDRSRIVEGLAGSGDILDRRVDAIVDMYELLRAEGEATKSELLAAIDVETTGYASEASVWSNMIKGKSTLSECPGVEPPRSGMSTWRYTEEGDV